MCIQNFTTNPEEKRSSRKTAKVLKAVLKRILQKYAFKLWTDPSEHDNEFSGRIKSKKFLEKLNDYQLLKRK